MSEPIITVENLGKRYRLGAGQKNERYTALRDVIAEKARNLLPRRGKLDAGVTPSTDPQEFWALKDVSFDIHPGEVVGIIGRNGAGKSTLLKILSRITEPTEGRITLRGRVASLLEVGTGFHPELTGRENIFLNGAVLGMQRAEIRAKFEEIVAFAEVERFLDTPVKRYSSGMYVRLAFAVAAHLEPEILIVDEVLAVGDAEFQKKCLGKMESVAKGQGRTVLFVSHNMGAVAQLCSRALLLIEGRMVSNGRPPDIIGRYLEGSANSWARRVWEDTGGPGDKTVRLREVCLVNEDGQPVTENVDVSRRLGVEVTYRVLRDGVTFAPSLHLHNAEGTQIFLAIDLERDWTKVPRQVGVYRSCAWLPANFFNLGVHHVSVACSQLDSHVVHFFERNAVAFNVAEFSDQNTARGSYNGTLPGVIRPILEWATSRVASGNETPRLERTPAAVVVNPPGHRETPADRAA